MVKNAIDVIVGGLTYWSFGYAFSFGDDDKLANTFSGWGYFFVNVNEDNIGEIYSHFFFQSSFATTATTIVSGAMAERTKLEAYIAFSLLNTLVFCFPAHWVWDRRGFLRRWGMVDIAGDGPVHLVGGMTGLVATLMLKPRYGRYSSLRPPQMGSPTNALLGMFMLWWGWLGFNCGSTFGISGPKWKLAARSAVSTLTASTAGGCVGLLSTFIFKDRKFDVACMINGILSSLVSVTGICALAQPWEGFVIGAVGAVLALVTIELLDRIKVDDPVGVVGVHAVSSIWGLISVGLFARSDKMRYALGICHKRYGLFYGGGAALLGIQTLGALIISVWSLTVSFILLKLIDLTIGLRMSLQHEIMGADIVEHAVGEIEFDKHHNAVMGLKRCETLGKRFHRDSIGSSEDVGYLPHRMINGHAVYSKGNSDRDGRDAKLMWRVAVGKALNPEEQSKRHKAIENFDLLFSQRHYLRKDANHDANSNGNTSSTFDGKNETRMDFNENSYENFGFSRDSVPSIGSPASIAPQADGLFARFRRNFQRKGKKDNQTPDQVVNISNHISQPVRESTVPSQTIYI